MLIKFFEKHVPPADAHRLNKIFTKKTIGKRQFFCRQDDYNLQLGILERGLARSFFITRDGLESTVCFSSEGMAIFDPVSFYGFGKARFNIQCLEKTTLHVTTREKLEGIYQSSPHLNRFGRQVLEESYVFMINRIMDQQTKTAEQRYKELLLESTIMLRVPQKYVASYLGITESSLSRIRRKIS